MASAGQLSGAEVEGGGHVVEHVGEVRVVLVVRGRDEGPDASIGDPTPHLDDQVVPGGAVEEPQIGDVGALVES